MDSSIQDQQKENWAEIEERLQAVLLAEPQPSPQPAAGFSIRSWDWLWNVEDNTIHFSRRVREWLGCGADELRDCFHDWIDRIHPEDYPEVIRRTREYFDGNFKRLDLEFRLLKSDGAYAHFRTRAHAVRKAGKTHQLFGHYTLVEEDRAQRESQELQDMIQAVPCGVSMLDLSGRYEFVNQAFADALGFTSIELIGRLWGETVHRDDLEAVSEAYESMLYSGRANLQCRINHRSGRSIPVDMLLAKRRGPDNSDAGHFCFCRPVESASVAA